MLEVRKCVECNKRLQGRTDKKFCHDVCRNSYNNRVKSGHGKYLRIINMILKKNREILDELLPPSYSSKKVSKNKLELLGFNFHYHTHQFINATGKTYTFCYDYGYLPLESNWFLIVRSLQKKVPERNFESKPPIRHFQETARLHYSP